MGFSSKTLEKLVFLTSSVALAVGPGVIKRLKLSED